MIFVDSGNMPFRITEPNTIIDSPSCEWIDIDGEPMEYIKQPLLDGRNLQKVREGWNVYILP